MKLVNKFYVSLFVESEVSTIINIHIFLVVVGLGSMYTFEIAPVALFHYHT